MTTLLENDGSIIEVGMGCIPSIEEDYELEDIIYEFKVCVKLHCEDWISLGEEENTFDNYFCLIYENDEALSYLNIIRTHQFLDDEDFDFKKYIKLNHYNKFMKKTVMSQ